VLLPVDILTPQEEVAPAYDPALELQRPRVPTPAPPASASTEQDAESLTTPRPRDSIR
jgi:hypothetical protein